MRAVFGYFMAFAMGTLLVASTGRAETDSIELFLRSDEYVQIKPVGEVILPILTDGYIFGVDAGLDRSVVARFIYTW